MDANSTLSQVTEFSVAGAEHLLVGEERSRRFALQLGLLTTGAWVSLLVLLLHLNLLKNGGALLGQLAAVLASLFPYSRVYRLNRIIAYIEALLAMAKTAPDLNEATDINVRIKRLLDNRFDEDRSNQPKKRTTSTRRRTKI